MNTHGINGNNWLWHMRKNDFECVDTDFIAHLNQEYRRTEF